MITNNKGVTLVELLISISIGSIVLLLLMSIMSSTLLTKNFIDHDNRLLEESYFVSEYVQSRVFELGVRTIEELALETEDHQVLVLSHEYDIIMSAETGIVRRDYSNHRSYVLHLDKTSGGLYYGPSENFNMSTYSFDTPGSYRINAPNTYIEAESDIGFYCIEESPFQGGTIKCSSAILELDLHITFMINDNPLLTPKRYTSTIVF